LLLASVVFDVFASRSRDEALRAGLRVAGFGSAIVGIFGGIGTVIAGLVMTRGRVLGSGPERIHHLFVWPAVISSAVLVGWRVLKQRRVHKLPVYLAGMGVASALMIGAGYSGGEMLLAAENDGARTSAPANPSAAAAKSAQAVDFTSGRN